VNGASLPKNLERRVPDLGLLQRAVSDLRIQVREVVAVEIAHQVGSTETKGGTYLEQGSSLEVIDAPLGRSCWLDHDTASGF
jgi:hypothetical protein